MTRSRQNGRLATVALAAALLAGAPSGRAVAQQVLTSGSPAVIRISDTAWAKLGVLLQPTADWLESSGAGTAQSMYIRRTCLLFGGELSKDLSFFVQTDALNFFKPVTTTANGVTTVTKTNSFVLQDAFLEWKLAGDLLMIDAGEMLVPINRDILTNVAAYLAIDIATSSSLFGGPTQSNIFRDTGFMAKGYLVGDGRLEYRLAVFDGVRQAGLRNPYRYTGYLQYNFFDVEKGYVYLGTFLGKKKVVNLSVGSDNQGGYHVYGVTGFAAIPVAGGDEIAGQAQFQHLDGEDFLAAIPRQNTVFANVGYTLHGAKAGLFLKYEQQSFSDAAQSANDVKRVGGGFNYYAHANQSLKVSAQFLRSSPRGATAPDTNEFTVQLQAYLW
jgi:hypothetical protein